MRQFVRNSLVTSLLLAGGFLVGGVGSASAQDEASTFPPRPAFIEAGDCGTLNPNPVATLDHLEPIGRDDDDEDDDDNEVVGTLTTSTISHSKSDETDFSWDDMLEQSHSVTVHESDENIATYVACGEIGGVIEDDKLVIALHPVDDSGFSGIAVLSENDGNVEVEIFLIEPGTDGGTPASTPVT